MHGAVFGTPVSSSLFPTNLLKHGQVGICTASCNQTLPFVQLWCCFAACAHATVGCHLLQQFPLQRLVQGAAYDSVGARAQICIRKKRVHH